MPLPIALKLVRELLRDAVRAALQLDGARADCLSKTGKGFRINIGEGNRAAGTNYERERGRSN